MAVFRLKISVWPFQQEADALFFEGDMPLQRCIGRLGLKLALGHPKCPGAGKELSQVRLPYLERREKGDNSRK